MSWYILNVNPEPWRIGPVGVTRGGGKIKAFVGRDQQLDAYKNAVREALGEQVKFEPPVGLRFFFWRNRAEYETPQARMHRKHEADLTNMQKATEDALQGVLFDNDRDVHDIRSVLVEQGPDVEGMIIIEAYLLLPFTDTEIPDHVWQRVNENKHQNSQDQPHISGAEISRLF